MGSPEIYYKRTLQAFAYNLNYATNKERAELLYEEESVNILEEEIMRWKDSLGEKEFYYQAGRTTEYVLNEADKNDGCDGFNACIGGICNFENFVGVNDSRRNIDRLRLKDVLKIINIYDRIVIGVNKHMMINYSSKDYIEEKYLNCEVDCIGTTRRDGMPCILIDIWQEM